MRIISIPALLLLAACASGPAPPHVQAAFVAPDRIEVRVRADEAAYQVALVDATGQDIATAPARSLGGGVRLGQPQYGVSASGGSSSGIDPGFGISIPVKGLFGPREDRRTESAARLIVPEAAAYAQRHGVLSLEIRFERGPPLSLPAPPPR